MLLAKDDRKQIVSHHKPLRSNIQILERTWNWAKEQLKTQELHKKLLLAQILTGKPLCTWQQMRANCGY